MCMSHNKVILKLIHGRDYYIQVFMGLKHVSSISFRDLSAWLMIQGTRESKILGGGGCFVPFFIEDIYALF